MAGMWIKSPFSQLKYLLIAPTLGGGGGGGQAPPDLYIGGARPPWLPWFLLLWYV